MVMYKSVKSLIENTPPNMKKSWSRCIVDCQFGKVNYYYGVSLCVSTMVSASSCTYVIIRK